MKKLLVVFAIVVFTLVLVFPGVIKAWFGAGSTPGWPPTTTGLDGQIALPNYKFSPDFYTVGNTVSINVEGINNTSGNVTSHYFLAISKVTQSPKGTDISNGTPSTPGINENDLNTNHQANNDVQSLITVIDLGNQTFPAKGNHTFGGSYLTTQPGYFQFDFMDMDPSGGYLPGHILAAGFFRVLDPGATTAPTPTSAPCGESCDKPTPTPTPVVPVPSPTTPSCGADEHLNLQGTECLKWQLGGPPPPTTSGGQVLGASTSKGEVLGASTLGATGNAYEIFGNSIIAVGILLTVISVYEVKKTV